MIFLVVLGVRGVILWDFHGVESTELLEVVSSEILLDFRSEVDLVNTLCFLLLYSIGREFSFTRSLYAGPGNPLSDRRDSSQPLLREDQSKLLMVR